MMSFILNETAFLSILKVGSNKLYFWDGEKWAESIEESFRTRDIQVLNDELISMSAMDVEGQPALLDLIPEEITEGENKGKWVLRLDVKFLERET